MQTRDILLVVFSAGGIAFLTAVTHAIKEWRDGSWTRREKAISDLERWRRDSDDAREWEAIQHQWWRTWAGRLEYVILQQLGEKALPTRPAYPEKEEVVTDEPTWELRRTERPRT
jgi:hypothetical protein